MLTQQAEILLQQWRSGQSEFPVSSSGTTGEPGIFMLKRSLIALSCRMTAKALSIGPSERIFCCLPTDKVGGMMQLFRSEVWQIPIDVAAPTTHPLKDYTGHASIISLTPMQLSHTWQDENTRRALLTFRVVLIGGAGISETLEEALKSVTGTAFYHTYGMTETYSHVALRRIGEPGFSFILPTEASLTNDGCLQFSNDLTENRVLQTSDVAIFANDGTFRISGRADNIINSGGVKISAESIEAIIHQHSGLEEGTFFCAGIPDEILGQKMVLVLLKGIPAPDLQKIPFEFAYLRPKEVMVAERFIFTETQKIRRKETLSLIYS